MYEKEKKLRMIMKMHGLGDGVYWLVSYLWWAALYVVYMLVFLVVGSAVNLKFFRKNNYGEWLARSRDVWCTGFDVCCSSWM